MLKAIACENNIETNLYNLPEKTHQFVFDFEYPLFEKVDKNKFETDILEYFIQRRIGFETYTVFKMQLRNKLNVIMPYYNKLFSFLDGWDLFADGETITHTLTGTDKKQTDSTTDNTTNNTTNSSTDNTLNSSTQDTSEQDLRNSKYPQNQIEDLKEGSYVSDANFNQFSNNGSSNSTGNTIYEESNKNTANTQYNETNNSTNTLEEETKRTPADKLAIYNSFIESKNNIMQKIYNELDVLFYQLVDM